MRITIPYGPDSPKYEPPKPKPVVEETILPTGTDISAGWTDDDILDEVTLWLKNAPDNVKDALVHWLGRN